MDILWCIIVYGYCTFLHLSLTIALYDEQIKVYGEHIL